MSVWDRESAGFFDSSHPLSLRIGGQAEAYARQTWARGSWAQAYEQKRMYREAIAEFQKAFEPSGGSTYALGSLGHAHAMADNRGKALQALADIGEFSKRRYVAPFHKALIYVALGDKERAFEWLGKAWMTGPHG